jgi:uncharacterized tellurite resistance protein B-like protein
MPDSIFEDRRKALEGAFFAKHNETLRQKLKSTFEKQATRESLRTASGITNEAVLDALMALQVSHETLAAFSLYPLIEIAWADGTVDERERQALLAAAEQEGIAPGSAAHALLEDRVRTPPNPEARKAWRMYASELNRKLNPDERQTVRAELLRRARAVAEASGGLLGLGNRISAKEEAVLGAIADAFAG